jgi:hypothetical protein
MTKILIVLNLILLTLTSSGQSLKDNRLKLLEKVSSVKKAEALIQNDSTLKGQVLSINQIRDTAEFYSYLFSKKVGEVEVFYDENRTDNFIVKILSEETIIDYRVSYIFLNNWIYSKSKIDSLRSVIFEKIKEGDSFYELASEYSMDGNAKKGGDLGWFEERQMVDIFENEVKNHKLEEIYPIDIPDKKWFYVVKNTYEPIRSKKITVIFLSI